MTFACMFNYIESIFLFVFGDDHVPCHTGAYVVLGDVGDV